VALVEFIKEDGGDVFKAGILEQLAEEDAFRYETDAGFVGDDAIEPDLVSDFLAELGLALAGDARCEHAGGKAAGLEDDDLAIAEEGVVEEYLGNLRGFAGAGGSLEDEAVLCAKRGYQGVLEIEDGEIAAIHAEVGM
jgi:hypothetical protein